MNFSYSFTNKYNLTQMLNKLRANITDLQQVNLKNSNWKLISDYKSEFNKTNKKWYIIIFYSEYMDENKFVAEKEEISIAGISNDGISVNGGFYKNPIIYRWDGCWRTNNTNN